MSDVTVPPNVLLLNMTHEQKAIVAMWLKIGLEVEFHYTFWPNREWIAYPANTRPVGHCYYRLKP